MKTVKLDFKKRTPNQISSSKGNQPKWLVRKKWYKADYMGYESLAEVVISRLLQLSDLKDFVRYEPVMLEYENKAVTGCVSDNFRKSDTMLITSEHLHRMFYGNGLAEAIGKLSDVKDRIKYTVDFIEKTTGLENAGAYITTLIELDAFFLNEDRHTNNLALLYDEKSEKYDFSPVFDNGLALLSDLNDYPIGDDILECVKRITAKPFSSKFDEQLDAAEELYGCHIKFSFTKQDINKAFEDMTEYYDNTITERVKNILFHQMNKYRYMFK